MIALILLSLSSRVQADETCPVATPAEQAAEIWRLGVQGEHGAAKGVLATADRCLGQAKTLVEPSELGHLYQWGGTSALHAGDTVAATRAFEAANRLAAAVGVDPRLGEAATAAMADAHKAVLGRGTGTVHALSEVWLDGIRLGVSQDRVVPAGEHMVQWVDAENLVHSELRRVDLGVPVEVGVAPVLPENPEPAPPARRRPVARIAASSALVVGGAVALFASGQMGLQLNLEDPEPGARHARIINALNFGGGVALALGTAGLVASSVQPTSSSTFVLPVVSGRW